MRSTAPVPPAPRRSPRETGATVRYPPDAAHCAEELLVILAYLVARDGPLQAAAEASPPSPWQGPLLNKAAERLEVLDAFMRARVSFLVAGKDHGYYTPQTELELAGATLDAGRAATTVVQALLASRLPSLREFDIMGETALRLHPAMEAAAAAQGPHRS
jgi:hypothetical protein